MLEYRSNLKSNNSLNNGPFLLITQGVWNTTTLRNLLACRLLSVGSYNPDSITICHIPFFSFMHLLLVTFGDKTLVLMGVWFDIIETFFCSCHLGNVVFTTPVTEVLFFPS